MSSHCARVLSTFTASLALAGTLVFGLPRDSHGDERGRPTASRQNEPATDRIVLSPREWSRLDRAVDRGLDFLSKNQEPDGSFASTIEGQPGVTSLCVMAFLSRGHQPRKGPYGAQLERAIDYVLSTQDPSSGAIMIDRLIGGKNRGRIYCHGMSGMMLAEVYGMTDVKRHERIRTAIVKALDFTRKQQLRPKRNPDERGGWRYMRPSGVNDADLSITAWQLMFLRAARNAEFPVPQDWVKEAIGYVRRSFDVNERGFLYALAGDERYCNRGMVGAGIVCLELSGDHQSPTAKEAGNWILRQSFKPYNKSWQSDDRYHYSAFYCSQAMFQLGGDYWRRFFPNFLEVLADAQHGDGSWDPESVKDGRFGNVYTTALAILALAPPYQILPIYQR
jgi:hypothetical protein